MDNKRNIDEGIKSYLNETAKNITCDSDMLHRIEEGIQKTGNQNQTTLRTNISNCILLMQMNMKKVVFSALCLSIVMSGGIFTFSEDARVWAKDSLNKATSFVYTVVYTGDGYKAVQTPEEPLPDKNLMVYDTIMPDSEISKIVGFNVRLPGQLEGGYSLNEKGWHNIKEDNYYEVYSMYVKDGPGLELFCYAQTDSQNPYVRSFYNLKPVRIGEVDAYWAESPYPIYPNNDPHNMPSVIVVYNNLFWIKDGVYNIIESTAPSQSQENVLAFAKAIINAKDTSYKLPQAYENYSTWTTFMYTDEEEAKIWMRGRVYFPYVIPDKLADDCRLKQKGFICKLPEDFKIRYSEDALRLIGASYETGSDRSPLNLVICDKDSIVSDWENAKKIAIGKIDAYWGQQTEKDFTGSLDAKSFPSAAVNTDSHFIAWKKGSVYYKIYMEKGDFNSQKEAIKYAKAIIKQKD